MSKFNDIKKGDKVVCINSSSLDKFLTVGSIYIVKDYTNGFYTEGVNTLYIKCDTDESDWFSIIRFEWLNTHRNDIINNILN